MKKTIYSFIITLIAFPIMIIGLNLEQEPLLVNGTAILQIVIPAFSFMLTSLFILLFDKEKDLIIIIGSSLAIITIADLVTINYFSFHIDDFFSGQGVQWLIGLAILVTCLNILALSLYRLIVTRSPKHLNKKSNSTLI